MVGYIAIKWSKPEWSFNFQKGFQMAIEKSDHFIRLSNSYRMVAKNVLVLGWLVPAEIDHSKQIFTVLMIV
jgi:hypothetical protein